MRVAIDYTAALNQRAGIGRFVRNLVNGLLAVDSGDEFVLMHAAPSGDDAPTLPAYPNVTARQLPLPERWMTIAWQRLGLPLPVEWFTGPVDLFHAPDFVLPPVRRVPSVLTVHDLAFLLYPECADASLRDYLMAAVPRSVRNASFVVADSENTRNDVICLLGAKPERTEVVPGGVERRFRPADAGAILELRQRLQLTQPFILTLGMMEPRKNWQGLIQAYSLARARHKLTQQLVLAGPRGWLWESVVEERERSPFRNDVLFLGFVPDVDLPTLYSAADAFAFPSFYEGFGLPPLEAMACGTPVVVADAASLPEVVGDAGLKVPPEDVEGLAETLAQITEDQGLRLRLRQAGLDRAATFSWEESGKRILDVYRRVLAS